MVAGIPVVEFRCWREVPWLKVRGMISGELSLRREFLPWSLLKGSKSLSSLFEVSILARLSLSFGFILFPLLLGLRVEDWVKTLGAWDRGSYLPAWMADLKISGSLPGLASGVKDRLISGWRDSFLELSLKVFWM